MLLLLVLSHKKPGMSQDSGLKKTILGFGRVNINLWREAQVPVRICAVQKSSVDVVQYPPQSNGGNVILVRRSSFLFISFLFSD